MRGCRGDFFESELLAMPRPESVASLDWIDWLYWVEYAVSLQYDAAVATSKDVGLGKPLCLRYSGIFARRSFDNCAQPLLLYSEKSNTCMGVSSFG